MRHKIVVLVLVASVLLLSYAGAYHGGCADFNSHHTSHGSSGTPLSGISSQLAFIVQPTNTMTGTAFNPVIAVVVQDAYGNTVTSAIDIITITVNPSGATLGGTTTVAAIGGIATFTGVTVAGTPGSYTLSATAARLTGAISNSFNLTPVISYHVGFIVQPTDTLVGNAFNPVVVVAVYDNSGNIVTSDYTDSISITLNPNSASLGGGSTTLTAIGGIVTFTGVSVVGIPSSYTLNATSSTPGISAITSNSFYIISPGPGTTPGVPNQLEFIISPTDTATGNAFSPDIIIAVKDISGTLLAFDNTDYISITLSPAGAALGGGNTTVPVTSGIAKFTGVTVTGTPATYTLTAAMITYQGVTITCSFRLCTNPNWLQAAFPTGSGLDVFNNTITADAGSDIILSPATPVTWTQCIIGTLIPARYWYAMAYDSGRGKIVLYGGGNTMGVYSDTWEWDGATWTKITTASSPGTRVGHAMVYDSVRHKTVLFGGCSFFFVGTIYNDIWEYDGTTSPPTWTEITTTSPAPCLRMNPGMAYDSGNQVMVIFGGDDGHSFNGSGIYYGDTWTWDGANRIWANVSNTGPSLRSLHTMAYVSGTGKTILFGGTPGGKNTFSDTWEWDGTTWTLITPTNSPPGRYLHAMVYDSVSNQTILFGGNNGSNTWLQDTWVYTGTTWSQKTISPKPPPRYGCVMAYDLARQRTVLFGGMTTTAMNDTWELNSTNPNAPSWTQVNLHGSPPARYGHAMAYDSLRHKTVLFGGEIGSIMQDTWEWDGITWTLMAPAYYIPNKRYYHAMAYDSVRHRTILFGGLGANNTLLQDIWDWDGKAWSPRLPANSSAITPCARQLHGMAYDPVNKVAVLFGGRATVYSLNDTWEWDGIYSTWTQSSTSSLTGGGGRDSFAMAYDSGVSGNKTILFSGVLRAGSNTYYNDTWKWDGVTAAWTQITTGSPVPTIRINSAMVYDSSRGVTVLFDGVTCGTGDMGNTLLNDTWELSGITWTQITTGSAVPSARCSHAMAYDSVRRKTVLFGGKPFANSGPGNGFYNDIWEYGQTYNTSGSYLSAPITLGNGASSWGVLTYNITTPTNTSITVDVLDSTTGNVLMNNVSSGASLQTINVAVYSVIKLRANLSTTDPKVTPALTNWRVEYQ